jgi:hypothetical protein
MGNPHCVIQVDDVETAAVETLGPVMESHERFPEREHRLYAFTSTKRNQACGSGGRHPGVKDAWNYQAVVLISPGKDRDYDWPGGTCL